jgi:hypothetical protein
LGARRLLVGRTKSWSSILDPGGGKGLTTTFQKRDYTDTTGRANLEVGCLVASTTKSVVSSGDCGRGERFEPMLAVVAGLAAVSHPLDDAHAISPHLNSVAISLVGGDLFAVNGDLINKHLQPPVHPCPAPCTLSSLPLLPLACAPGLGVAHTPRHSGCARRASRCRTTRSSTPSSPPTTRSADVRAVRLRPERWVPRSAGGSVDLCAEVAGSGLVELARTPLY